MFLLCVFCLRIVGCFYGFQYVHRIIQCRGSIICTYIYVYAASFAPSSEFRLKSLHLQFKCRKRAKRSRDEMRRRNEVPDNCQTRNTLKKGHSPKGMEEELGAATPTPTYIDTPSATFCFVFFLFFLDCLQFSYHLIKIAKFRTRFHFRFPFLSVPFLCVRV